MHLAPNSLSLYHFRVIVPPDVFLGIGPFSRLHTQINSLFEIRPLIIDNNSMSGDVGGCGVESRHESHNAIVNF